MERLLNEVEPNAFSRLVFGHRNVIEQARVPYVRGVTVALLAHHPLTLAADDVMS